MNFYLMKEKKYIGPYWTSALKIKYKKYRTSNSNVTDFLRSAG